MASLTPLRGWTDLPNIAERNSMLAIYDQRQELHRPITRIAGGVLKPHPEQPERVLALLAALQRLRIKVINPEDRGVAAIRAVHDEGYLSFLELGFDTWRSIPDAGPELRSSIHPNEYMRRMPQDLLGRAGFYQADGSCVIVEGTWPAARASANTAIDAMKKALEGERSVYALCRPPGHHAYSDKAGGFCYLNNTAIAARVAQSAGARVAVLDVDVHHGNGTQTLFYGEPDILTVSVHGDPANLYPFYASYADECGTGASEGSNVNIPIPLMSDDSAYVEAERVGIAAVETFSPDILIVALGLDASASDPFACMRVSRDGFARMGEQSAKLRLPTLIVQEGGYVSSELGPNLQAYLEGFMASQ
jgi:acetoin utilization deacetylase AcuC-like enzyme